MKFPSLPARSKNRRTVSNLETRLTKGCCLAELAIFCQIAILSYEKLISSLAKKTFLEEDMSSTNNQKKKNKPLCESKRTDIIKTRRKKKSTEPRKSLSVIKRTRSFVAFAHLPTGGGKNKNHVVQSSPYFTFPSEHSHNVLPFHLTEYKLCQY